MTQPLRIALAGLGTVGVGLVKILQNQRDLITARAGREVVLVAVSARSRSKDRGVDLSGFAWEDDPVALARRDDIDLFVEVMGGEDGPAKAATEAALTAGHSVVTANKAMLARHGTALATLAEAQGAQLRFEAGVAGGIPVVKALTEGMAGNVMTRVIGVMNGTCNYILTRMDAEGLSYDEVFEAANQLGYLEADPQLDVGGIDAGHKLSLLAAIGFGTRVSFGDMVLEGIDRVSIDDIRLAGDMNYKIKLLGVAQMTGRGLEQRMTPCLVPDSSPLGQLEGATNMVVLEGDAVGQIVLRGAGAGEGPTASAVMADICDIARGLRVSTFGQAAGDLAQPTPASTQAPGAYYLRMGLEDKPGALAKIATVLGENGISIDRMRQYGHPGQKDAPVLIVTHKTDRPSLDAALAALPATGVLASDPVALRIEDV